MILKKKKFICSRSLSIGGVEKALVALVNSMDLNENEVDLLLMIPDGELKNDIKEGIQILETPKCFDWIGLRKDRIGKSLLMLVFHPIWLYYYLTNIIRGLLSGRMAEARQRMWNQCIEAVPMQQKYYDEALDFSGILRKYVLYKVDAKKKLTWIHSDYRVFGYNKEIDESLLMAFDNICCVTPTCKMIFDSEFPNLSSKSSVVYNIIDCHLIQQRAQEGDGFKDDFTGIRLLDITRLDPNKGLDIAVRVCRELKDKGLNFRWYILGNDPLGYRKELEKLIESNGVNDEFILLGFTQNPYPYLLQCDIVVHFSRFEGRSVAIDEALAFNKPILLTNYPTAKDQITNGVNGFICDFDETQLTSQLEKMITETLNERTT